MYLCRMFRKPFFLLAFIVIVLSSCSSKHAKVVKSADNEMKFEVAMDLYERKDYNRSLELLDLLQSAFRGTPKAEEVAYYTAKCYYNTEDYTIAGYYFKRFYQNFPYSNRAEECLYMNGYCYFLDSPRSSLDQVNTQNAIKELQLFINTYPKSDRVQEANGLIDELRAKLEYKDYRICMMYYRMQDYMACIASLQNLMKNYPGTERREEIMYTMSKAYYEYAERSIPEKKRERYEAAIEMYNNLLYLYPESEYIASLETVNTKARKKLELIK